MLLGGLQKSSLIDYSGKLACVVFTVGCNFRCPFCHNKSLVNLANFRKSDEKEIIEEELFKFLKSRQKLLDGVCITGGEPTLHPDLPEFIQKIKDLGYSVKLDTNGTNPEMLRDLFSRGLVDYVAMDLKTNFDGYTSVVGRPVMLSVAKHPDYNLDSSRGVQNDVGRSINLILTSDIPFEFRTTIVPGLHTKASLIKLAKDIKKAAKEASVPVQNIPWYLQNFRPNNCLDASFNSKDSCSEDALLGFVKALKPLVPRVTLR